VRRAGPAEGVQHEVARVVAGLDDGLAQQVAGLRVLHRVDRGRGFGDGQPERLGDVGVDRLPGQVQGQRLAPPSRPRSGRMPSTRLASVLVGSLPPLP
jgi:hypothetical protein